MAFLNVKTRLVVLSPATLHPDAAWVSGQAEDLGAMVAFCAVTRTMVGNSFGDTFSAVTLVALPLLLR
ncbi:MAG TPA: hypothetical protein VHV55_06285 [Pirellulales bacterium]|nr:hypothetical protein [Pirellulales bacterium]